MSFFEKVKNWFKSFGQKVKNGWSKLWTKPDFKAKSESGGNMFVIICSWVYKLRSIFLAIPVLFVAVIMAIQNMARLPEKISIYFPGENILSASLTELSREVAVFGPLLVTVLCLAMMFLSRRVSYPWLISVFSLLLPPFLYFITVFPG